MITCLQVRELSWHEHEAVRCTRALHAYLQSVLCSSCTAVCVTTHAHDYTPGCLLRKLQEQEHLNVEARVSWSFLASRPHFERSLTLRGACWSLAALRGPFVCVERRWNGKLWFFWRKALKSTDMDSHEPIKSQVWERGGGLIQAHEIYLSILFHSGTCIKRESSPSRNIWLVHSLHKVPQHMDALLKAQS